MSDLKNITESINNTKDFIKDIDDFLESHLKGEFSLEIYLQCMSLIMEHNKNIVNEKRLKLEALGELMTIKEETPSFQKEFETGVEITLPATKKSLKDYEDLINKMSKEETLITQILPKLEEQNIKELKLAVYQRILLLEKEIKESIIENPSKNILPLQQKYLQLQSILRQIIAFAKPKEEENLIDETTTKSKRKIFFLPNGKGSTYLVEDIANYIEKREEIQNALNKIRNGYFLISKDTKPIRGTKEKLFEYTNPNGIRILFIVMKENTYAICGMFYKDKNKSTRITEYYEEVVQRFEREKASLEENINNPNLYIEQAELVGELYTILEKNTPVLKEVL